MNLTPKQIQAIRIAVAEVDGWKNNGCDIFHKNGEARGLVYDPGDGESPWGPWEAIPNYPESLDDVNGVEKGLTADQHYDFRGHLVDVTYSGIENQEQRVMESERAWISATALQRCIAILMTINPEKWLEIQNLKD